MFQGSNGVLFQFHSPQTFVPAASVERATIWRQKLVKK